MNIVFVYYWKLVCDRDQGNRQLKKLRKGINVFCFFFYTMLERLFDYCALSRLRENENLEWIQNRV